MPEISPDGAGRSAESRPRVAVVGGGATGCGVARDLAMRGCDVTLIEFGDLGSGTSSRFHGMLQSGARYAVSDTTYAAECMRERRIIAEIAPEAVEQTGGLFVSLPEDPPEFAEHFAAGCKAAEIPVAELEPQAAMAGEPAISREIVRAFSVPDATIDPWRLVNLLADDVKRRGGTVLTRHQVTGFDIEGGRVSAVRVARSNLRERRIEVDAVVNAAGPWSARIANMVGGGVGLQLTKGSILVLAHRLVRRAVNRCRPATSHDIVVPSGTVSLFGTTSEVVDDPDTTMVRPAEIQELLEGAEPLIPAVRDLRMLRAWAGVRPLVKPQIWSDDQPLPRRHAVIDHAELGVEGFLTVCGGSLTTHRAMAEDVTNHICRRFGINQPCRTSGTPLAANGAANGPITGWRPAAGYEQIEQAGRTRKSLCECEAVDRQAIQELLRDREISSLHDVRRRLRVGFGPCQGSFCGSRLAELLAEVNPDFATTDELGRFWTERLKGSAHTAWGDQARQLLLSDAIYRGALGLRLSTEILPSTERR